MARKTPTEEELGLAPTEEELETVVEAGDEGDSGDDDAPLAESGADEPADEGDKGKPEPAKPAEEPKMVDVRAVQEARAEAREAKQHAAILEQRWNDFLAAQRAPKEEAKPEKPEDPFEGLEPDDYVGRLERATQLIAEDRRTAAQQTAEQRAATERETVMQQHLDFVQKNFTEAVQTDPEVEVAYKAATASLDQELQFLGYQGKALEQARKQTFENFVLHASQAVQNGQPIAEFVKGLAKSRGWQPAPAVAEPAPKPATDVAAVAAAQQRHQSLSDAPGGETVAPLDAKALARMSDKEFKAWISKRGNEQKFDEIMGG